MDGAEIKKLDFELVSTLSGKEFTKRQSLPAAIPLIWDPCHQIERIYKRLCARVEFLKAQINRLSELRSIFSLGIGKYNLEAECSNEGANFYVAKKDASTRWVAHKEATFKNHLKTLPQQKRLLSKAKSKIKERRALADELGNAINLALVHISMDCTKPLSEFSISGQDQDQIPWEYPRKALQTLNTLKRMSADLKLEYTSQMKFRKFPMMLKNLSVIDQAEFSYEVQKVGVEAMEKIKLSQELPIWLKEPPLQSSSDDEDLYASYRKEMAWQRKAESEINELRNSLSDRDSWENKEILLTSKEHKSIRDFIPDLDFRRSGNVTVDQVTKQTLSLLGSLIYQFEICIMNRIPYILILLRECFDFTERFQLLDQGKFQEYKTYNFASLMKLCSLENKFLELSPSSKRVDSSALKRESESALTELSVIYQEKKKELDEIKILKAKLKTNPREKAKLKRQLENIQGNCWWDKKDGEFVLRELKVVKTMRTMSCIWKGNPNYMRLLTRGAVRKPSEAVVEQIISIVNMQNRENLDWGNLLTEVQFRTFGPYAHEWGDLVEELYNDLHEDQKMRSMVQHPELRRKRSAHLEGSVSTTRLKNRTSKFQGFVKTE